MIQKAAARLDHTVLAAAHAVTRRRLLRNVGGAALGATFATAYMGVGEAYAHADDACGNSPMCPGERCNGFSCADGRGDTTWRAHNRGECVARGDSINDNCWTAQAHGITYRCCDCCINKPGWGTNACWGCPGADVNWRWCICGAPA